MSRLRDDWSGALPAIGEESTKDHGEVGLVRPRRRAGSVAGLLRSAASPPQQQQTTIDATSEGSAWIPIAQSSRRRFHSSDVTPVTRRQRSDPCEALRGDGRAVDDAAASPVRLMQRRQRRRAQSDVNVNEMSKKNGVAAAHRDRCTSWAEDSSRLNDNQLTHNGHDDNFPGLRFSDEVLQVPGVDDGASDGDVESCSDSTESRCRSRRSASEDSNASALSSGSFYSNTFARSYGSVEYNEPASTVKLQNLQMLYQEGFITVTEYKNRRLQLVDELTLVNNQTIKRTADLIQTGLPVVHREPPDFTLLRERDAVKHVFDSEKRRWTSARIKVKIDPQPFARGGLRQVFHLQDLSVIPQLGNDGRPVSYVAKIAIDPNEDPDTYFRDVEMQAVASKFAKLYNSYHPPRRVEFLDAWIMQLIPSSQNGCEDDTSNITMRGMICGVERYIPGEYHKHNNNFGYVSELERNTPQAFSHFTFEASGRQMLIVDIQGVADHYTDPQIHTRSGKEFGKGNLSVRGFERFLASHRCNPICRYLKLPLNNDSDGDEVDGPPIDPKGTVPAQTYMSQPRIRIKRVDSELCHYYGDSKAFKEYQARRQHHDQDVESARAFVAAVSQQRNCASYCGIGSCTIT
ncbi:hypothetical protein PINS_up000735 [Pythium insidiosum]|nr:hypothetical protein PINS_up000735 [Pythium insidiosum]